MGEYDALRQVERDRLERFAAAFEDVDPMDYDLFGGTTASDADVEAARSAAIDVLATGPRRQAARRATEAFADAADRAISRRMPPPQVMLAPRPGGGAIDRARLIQALERAVVAVILWDDLDAVRRDVLLGPWARVAERALAEAS